MFCKNCGADAGGNKFCTKCGAPVTTEANAQFVPVPHAVGVASKPIRRGSMPFNPVAVLFAIISVAGVFVNFVSASFLGASYLDISMMMFDYGGALPIIFMVLPMLFIAVTLISSFFRSRISSAFAVIGLLSFCAFLFYFGEAVDYGFLPSLSQLAEYIDAGFIMMPAGLLLNALSQIFYHPNRA